MLLALVLSHFAVALVIAVAEPRLGRRSAWLGVAPFAATAVWAISVSHRVLGGSPVEERVEWVPSMGISIDLTLDPTALLMALVVSIIGTGILTYTMGYSSKPGKLAGRLAAFGGAMLGLVVSDNLFALFVFWELTTVISYALVAYDDRDAAARRAGLQALLVTAAGGLVMLAGFVLLGAEAGTFRISEIASSPPTGAAATAALVLISAGVLTKSAQVPFHGWLPGAMAAPTPASGFLHSATMVKAGVFLVLRLTPIAAGVAAWETLLVVVGFATMLLGGWTALRETDLKRILAYGTVAQLGLLTALMARGATVAAAAALLLAHAAFKATLFLVVGIVDRSTGRRDIRRLGGLRHDLPVVFGVAAVAGASMAGVPLTFGFVAKEAALDVLVGSNQVLLWIMAAGAVLTVAYTLRLLSVFVGPRFEGVVSPVRIEMILPAVVLGAVGVVLGIAPAPAAWLVEGVADAAGVAAVKLPAWPGLKPALAVSLATLLLGTALSRVPIPFRGDRRPADAGFDAAMAGLLGSARLVTATLQNGSLPTYLVVILLTAVVVPGVAAVGSMSLPGDLVAAESWIQVTLVLVAALAAAGVVALRSRLGAVLMLGVVGYGMAGLFALQGAPDLALTQVLVETVTLVVFAIVLSRLPPSFQSARRPAIGPAIRTTIALAVGAFVTVGSLAARAARTAEPISTAYLERSLPDGKGRNVVNVILTDFRALDTFGEIAVVATAAIGIAGLVTGFARQAGAES